MSVVGRLACTEQMSGGVLEPVVAPEQLVVDRDGRNPIHAELKCGIGRSPQRFFDLRIAGAGVESITVDASLLTGLEDVRSDAQIAAVLECVAKCLEREFAPFADGERVRRRVVISSRTIASAVSLWRSAAA